MANMLMMRYAAQRMAKEDGKYQERGIGNDEHGHPLPYREPRPEFGEMPKPENRYRGDDGRYRPGTRRNASGEHKWEFSVEPKDEMNYPGRYSRMGHPSYDEPMYGRMGGDEDYYDPTGRVIGFGEAVKHHKEKHSEMMRGSHDMQGSKSGMMEYDELVEYIHEELVCAEEYAKEAVKHKKRFPELADVYHRISADKATHADMLSKQAKMMAEKNGLTSDWEKEHTKIKQKMTEVGRCMEEFRS